MGNDEQGDDPAYALDIAASELRADREDSEALVEALAARLQGALGSLVSVQRRKVGGWRSKQTQVAQLVVDLGESRYELVREPVGFRCTRHRVVRAITLKREEIPLAQWVAEVIAAVSELSAVGEADRRALEAMLA